LFTRCEVRGKHNIPSQGPILVVSNHLSLADPPLLGFCLGRRVMFMAKAKLFRFRVIGYLIGKLGAFPVRKGRPDMKAIRQAQQALTQGLPLVIFPEGMRSRSGKLEHSFSGAALIAFHSSVPILPVGITGTKKLDNLLWLPFRPRITVNIGRPFYLPSIDSKLTKARLKELNNYITEHIAELLPVEYRGTYIREIRWH
jgi:1-acyl-sn-glycerol-3-phosphate acyltransferase